ncbi:MAG: DNA helicase [uncultured Sulfurovum sp.]|uniref:DNA helicase n=1 Tax=uncultured Sulfurovum sp. TaxID=269237 RepID=A0A6S6SS15_9BACT|nr:MAG: DNA helicase [uncultured Sulfurovum sp.]
MPLKLIPSDETSLIKGEKQLLARLKKLYTNQENTSYVYLTPRIDNVEPDFLLIDSQRGIVVFETKDWTVDYLSSINPKEVVARDGKKYHNPAFRCNQYFNSIKSLFSTDLTLLDNDLELTFNLYAYVVFTAISSDKIKEDKLKKLTLEELFPQKSKRITKESLDVIRGIIYPEIQLQTSEQDEISQIIKTLDIEQELFAKRLPIGHYLISGVPGSGKTVVLIARAIHLLKAYPNWKIAIVTYNNSLTQKIKNRLEVLNSSLYFHHINLLNIEVTTFHKFALKASKVRIPRGATQSFWNEELAQKALDVVKPSYDAILVDEYQDFRNSWLKVCIKSLKKHKDKENEEQVNLFLAGDRLQSIYNPTAINWHKDIGLNMQGRAKIFKKSYRAGEEHLNFSLKYLMSEQTLKKEVEKFYEGSGDIESKIEENNSLFFIEGQFPDVVIQINTLLNEGYLYSEILVLANTWKEAQRFYTNLPPYLKEKAKASKEVQEGIMNITTYHSSKGLESKVSILLNVDTIHEKKLLYVGTTRASQRLYMHSSNFKRGVGENLKAIANC